MYCQSNRWLIGRSSRDTIFLMSEDVDEVARLHLHQSIRKLQPRCALQNDDPFAVVLVVPEVQG